MTTFRTDPRTGRATISPGNIVRADGRTDNERSQIASQFTADPGQEQNYRQAERDYQEFLQSSGRSSTNPFGDAGVFGGGVNFSGIMTPRQIEDVNRLAYNQYLGLASGRGTQRGGIGDFIPGYAPALKIGSNTPRGRVVAAPNQPKQGGIFSLSPMIGILQNLFGRGNTLRALDDGDKPLLEKQFKYKETTPGYDELADQGSGVFTLVSAQPRKTTDLFNLEGFIENLPKTGVGRFVDQVQEKFNMGRGKLVPFFDPKKGQVGLNYKIPISQQSSQFVPDGGVTTPDGMNPFRDILRTPVINPDVSSNMPVISEDNIEKYRRRPLPGQERSMTPVMRDIFRFKSQFPAGV
tara:strand:+ start:49 stop:1101 length:1053 start_codon:yes stop_codon:yes gene_type:complete